MVLNCIVRLVARVVRVNVHHATFQVHVSSLVKIQCPLILCKSVGGCRLIFALFLALQRRSDSIVVGVSFGVGVTVLGLRNGCR